MHVPGTEWERSGTAGSYTPGVSESGSTLRTLVLQHIACEPPGVFEDVLHERGAELHRVELDQGEPLPDWREFDAIVAMGGPMSATDDAELPWLTGEKRLIRRRGA